MACLRHQARPGSETVGCFVIRNPGVLLGQDGVAHPHHAVLHGKHPHRQQCGLLVARWQRRHGEARRELVLELLRFPQTAGGVHEGLERTGDSAQVGGRAQDEAVVVQQAVGCVGQVFGLA